MLMLSASFASASRNRCTRNALCVSAFAFAVIPSAARMDEGGG